MYDTRLLGRWRSNAPRTRREIAARRDISRKTAAKLGSLFGRLELRFTRSRCYITLDEYTEVSRYLVVAKDASSVVTVANGEISHFHFERHGFWIGVGDGRIREFFRRIR